ncbi:general substrate transporter [Dacryopinax primogenitus]|uniref:General substrate transporter n=1 Tax=Dacryopinax primogenitus (strain DJM 731) TaxID=1858805 RepID=M5GG37_DACPD|nr:general substrate transporter [Dacryopinax primogenitus]EJU04808.1 general substrate transporter [Dacryopinax primogenitus]
MAHYSSYNILIILILTLGSISYGYAFSVTSNTLGQPGFLHYFGLDTDPGYANSIEGAINGLFSAGGTFGALLVGWMNDAHGRKKTMNLAAVICIVGSALQAGSVGVTMFLVARFVTGWGIGMMVVLIPIFQAEVSPPTSRGLLVGQHGWVGVGTFYSSNLSFQWRFPIAVSCLWPAALLLFSPGVPESPRWLLLKGRQAEAWAIISRLHSRPNDPDQSYAQAEFRQMSQQVLLDQAAWERGGGPWQVVTKPSYRKRMWMGFFTQYAAQTTGAMVVYNYIVLLYEDLGYTGATVLMLGAGYVTVAAAANFLASFIMDYLGRCSILSSEVIGLSGCMLSLACESAMTAQYAGTSNKAGNAWGVVFIFIFIFFYAGGIDATSYVYCSEIFPTHIRSQGMAFSMLGTFLSTVAYLDAAPTALARIGWWYYVFFICMTAVNIGVMWWVFPETKGLSLEEINGTFGDEVVSPLEEEKEVFRDERTTKITRNDGK